MSESPPQGRPPIQRRMGRAALIVGAGVLLSRVFGLVRDIVFAAVLGADALTDEYQVAFQIPDFLNYMLAGGYMAITFIPILSRYLAADDEEGGWRAFSAIAKPLGVAMAALVALAMLLARPVIDLIQPGFDAEQVDRAVTLTRIVLPAQFFFVIGSLFMAVQYAKERFGLPTLAPIVYNLGIIIGGVAFNLGDEPRPEGFAWGVLAGAIVGNFLLQWYGAHRAGLRVTWDTRLRDPTIKEYLLLAVPLMIGQSLVVLDEQFGRSFGGLIGDEGAITWLQFARRTMLVPVGVIAQAAAVATYPFLARLVAEGRHREMAQNVGRALRYVLVFSLGAAAALLALSVPIIRLLYERGDWTLDDTVATAGALAFFGLSVPIWGIHQVVARGFYARREMWTPVVIGTGAALVAVPIYWVLGELYDVRGLALASTISMALYTLVLTAVWYERTGWEHLHPVLVSGGRALALAATGGLAAWGAAEVVQEALPSGSVIGGLAALVVAAAAFFLTVFLGGSTLSDLRRDPDLRA